MSRSLSFEPLSTWSFLERSAQVFPSKTAVVDGERRISYAELRDRSQRLAGALAARGIEPGDRVAVLAPNTPLLLECHFGVPACGAVLVALNSRLRPAELAAIVQHSGARALLCDAEFEATASAVVQAIPEPPIVIVDSASGEGYETMIAEADSLLLPVEDETGLLALNYTSGTTGAPKGVMYHHRGAYLQSLAMALHARLDASSSFLWTLPMFHCNGWCFTWAVTAMGGTHVCLRKIDARVIWTLIHNERVTHLNAAPIVLASIAQEATAATVDPPLHVCTGGAPPSPTLIARLGKLGMHVTHLYGLTETFGPIMICEPQADWADLEHADRSKLVARQGVGNIIAVPPRVVDGQGHDVPADGVAMGEIALRGNDVTLGYFQAPDETSAAAPDGWLRTGDLAVRHSDGYIEIRDRAKDLIISGGENIASVEVERVLEAHPGVTAAAVVAAPDERWGERPVAFVTLTDGAEVSADELIAWVKSRLAGFKAPREVVFGELPMTSTGKVMKHILRRRMTAG